MVLIRKRYFVQHLESVKRREKARTAILQRISGWVHVRTTGHTGNNDNEKIEIHVKQPSTMTTMPERSDQDLFDPSEGIGAALVGGGSAGIGLSIAFGQNAKDSNAVPYVNETAQDQTSTSPEGTRFPVESPLSLTESYRLEHLAGFGADAHSFTSSPRSGALPLPMSPTSRDEAHPAWSTRFVAPPQMRYRRGVVMRNDPDCISDIT